MRLDFPRTAALAGTLALVVFAVSCSQATSPATESAEQGATPGGDTGMAPAAGDTAGGVAAPAGNSLQQSAAATPPAGAAAQSAPAGSASQSPVRAPAPSQPLAAPAVRQEPPAVAAPPPPRQVTLLAGTSLMVRTTSTISTKTAKAGDSFMASLEEPIVDGMWMIAPKGASVQGTVVSSDAGGRVQGTATLAVRINRITADDGQTIEVTTTPQSFQAESSTKKDALKVGIATGVGAAIGAIAGGGKGAAIGAGVGAGAGTGTVLATRGDAAVLPSETVLSFELASPVNFTERR